MTAPDPRRRLANARAFDALVADGIYTEQHTHAAPFRDLFRAGLRAALTEIAADPLRVIEIGCGAGAWLAEAQALLAESGRAADLHGSDLSGGMISVCRKRFADWPADRLFVGDILTDSGYGGARYDLIFTYDVVQQLPRAQQSAALDAMLARLAPRGALVVFDNESRSAYGRKMALKKALTRIGIPLVPRFFCNAAYPSLRAESDRLSAAGHATEIIDTGLHKRALVIRAR